MFTSSFSGRNPGLNSCKEILEYCLYYDLLPKSGLVEMTYTRALKILYLQTAVISKFS